MGGAFRKMPQVEAPKVSPAFHIGDKVTYEIPGYHYDKKRKFIVIGYPSYDVSKSVVVIADEMAHGMPILDMHCTLVETGFYDTAMRLRDRYNRIYPDCLLPLG